MVFRKDPLNIASGRRGEIVNKKSNYMIIDVFKFKFKFNTNIYTG